MNIHDLSAATGFSERQIRFLIAEGFMPGPVGGRARAQYGETHLAVIRRYQRLKALGFPPAAIRQLMSASVGAPFPVAPGITLVVAPELIGVKRDIEPLEAALRQILTQLFEGDAP